MRKTGALVGIMALIIMLGAGCSGSVGTVAPLDTQNSTATYSNIENKFQIDYPKDWDKKEGAYGTVVAFVSPQNVGDDFPENLTVVSKATEADVHDYVASAVNSAPKSYKDFKLLDDQQTTLAGEDGEMITYTFTEGELKVYTREVFTVKNGRLYDLTFTNSQADTMANWDMGQKMIASFKITE
jgi:hypothetical protein